jgi:hypothetical protein
MGVDPTDFSGHKRFLAFFAGGMLPIISLSFLHMLVQFTEEDRVKEIGNGTEEKPLNNVEAKDIIGEVSRLRLSDNDLEILEKHLLNPEGPNEKLKEAAQRYSDEVREKHTHIDDFEETSIKSELTQEERGEILAEMMKNDQELGLYDEPLVKEEKEDISDWDATLMDGLEDEEPFFTEEELEKILQEEPTEEEIQRNFSTIEPETENIFQEEDYVPSLSDEEIMNMNQDEYERNLVMEDEFDGFVPEPFATPEEVEEFKIDVVLETPLDNNIINVVIDEDVLIPPTQTNPSPTPNEQVIKIDFSTPEDPTLVDTDVEKKNN